MRSLEKYNISLHYQPNICVLLDVGTRPGNNSIYRLWKTFDVNSNVGGACGEIAVYKGKNWQYLLNPLGLHPLPDNDAS